MTRRKSSNTEFLVRRDKQNQKQEPIREIFEKQGLIYATPDHLENHSVFLYKNNSELQPPETKTTWRYNPRIPKQENSTFFFTTNANTYLG